MKARLIQERKWLSWLQAAVLGASAGAIADSITVRPANLPGLAQGFENTPATLHSALNADEGLRYRSMFLRIGATEVTNGHLDLHGYLHLKQLVAAWLRADLAGCLNALKQTGDLDLVTDEALAAAAEKATGGDFVSAVSLCPEISSGIFRDKTLSPQTRAALQKMIEPNVDPAVWAKLEPLLNK